jgi:3-ketosteroid 9alpha-monooxygenase subunit B
MTAGAGSGRTYYRVPVAEVISETEQACSLVLAVPPELAVAFTYAPGQFLTVRIPAPGGDGPAGDPVGGSAGGSVGDPVARSVGDPVGGSVARCYSLSSSPAAGDRPTITVKRMPSGYASNWIADHVSAGSVLELLPPAGTFTPRSLDSDFLLFAGGSGITPVMSILKSALVAGRGRIVLVYANADEQSVIFAGQLRQLQVMAPHRLTVVHWLDVLQGPPDAISLRELARPYAGFDAYLCGPDPYMAVIRQVLSDLGVPGQRTHVERFLSLAENPFETTEITGGTAAVLQVSLDDQVHRLDWPAGTRMLDVLIDADLDPPYSCREGICGACACRLVAGQVEMAHNEALAAGDLADGYVLACQSVAVSAEISVSYS